MKFYAVVKGKIPGIYTDWNSAKQQVIGYSGAVYKSFPTREQAEQFMGKSTTIAPTVTFPEKATLHPIIYTDGSYKYGEGGFGVVILMPNGDIYTAYGHVPLKATNNVAELYAIYVALSLSGNYPVVDLYSDSQYSINSVTTYIHNYIRKGWVGVANADLISTIYSMMDDRTVHFHHVPAHVGHRYNEQVDQLANTGRERTDELVVMKNGYQIELD